MPLILAAIDVKLSSSYQEMTTRKKRLDTLSAIVRHSYTLYDITDYVAVGINHILRLAYLTTKSVFLQPKQPSERRAIQASHSGDSMGLRTQAKQAPKPIGRATSWLDAFVVWPRAYLLISTSVDYSLAVGRLPCDSALPELVRHIPAMGTVLTLPWTMKAQPVGRKMDISSLGFRRQSGNQATTRSGSSDVEERAQRGQSDLHPGRVDTGMAADNDSDRVPDDNPESENRVTSNGPMINLNYMDLGGVPNSDDNILPAENNNATDLSSPKDHEPGLEESEDHFTGETVFDSSLLDELSHELFGENWDGVVE